MRSIETALKYVLRWALLGLAVMLIGAAYADGAGAKLYQSRCAHCHELVQNGIPPRSAIAARSVQFIVEKLSLGSMQSQALGLSDAQIEQVAAYLAEGPAAPQPEPVAPSVSSSATSPPVRNCRNSARRAKAKHTAAISSAGTVTQAIE